MINLGGIRQNHSHDSPVRAAEYIRIVYLCIVYGGYDNL